MAADGPIIWVDADACPVKAEVEAVANRTRRQVQMVTNGGLRPSTNPLVATIYVASGPDEADKHIAARVAEGDVVVTTDIPLAAKCVAAGARVLRPDGSELTSANIGNVLATRDLMADLRAADPFRQGGGRPFSKADRARFSAALDRLVTRSRV
jgi:uncharacterized protein YaiI (UPF0178 family)